MCRRLVHTDTYLLTEAIPDPDPGLQELAVILVGIRTIQSLLWQGGLHRHQQRYCHRLQAAAAASGLALESRRALRLKKQKKEEEKAAKEVEQ